MRIRLARSRLGSVVAGCIILAPIDRLHAQLPGYEIVPVTSGTAYHDSPVMNNCGQIVYAKRPGDSWSTAEIYLYDNGKTFRLTNDNNRDVGATIDDTGRILWSRGIGNAGVTQIMLYEDGVVTVFRDNPDGAAAPMSNASGTIVWEEFHDRGCWSSDGDVYLYEPPQQNSWVSSGSGKRPRA